MHSALLSFGASLLLVSTACTDSSGEGDDGASGTGGQGGGGAGASPIDRLTMQGGSGAGSGAGHSGTGSGGASGGAGGDDGDDDDAGSDRDGATDGAAGSSAPAFELEMLFASEQLPSFYLTLPDASWQQLATCNNGDLAQDPLPAQCAYQPGTFHATYDPNPYDAVSETAESVEQPIGVRLKGRASFRSIDSKPALKVKFTEGSGERFLGLSRLTLNNMVQDPSAVRERMAYLVYRNAGVQAPLANSARVYVQHGEGAGYEYYGLYVNVQTLDRRFVEHAFGEVGGEVGNLYDTKNNHYFTDFDRSPWRDQAGPEPGAQEALFQLETNDTAPNTSDLTAAIDAVYDEDIEGSASQLVTSASPVIDVDQWLRVSAAQALLADWDAFASARNNYKAYHDLVRDKFVILPWGTDQTFGYSPGTYEPNWHYALAHETSGRGRPLFLLRCLSDAWCSQRYMNIVAEVAATFDTQALLDEVDRIAQQIEASVLEDERRESDDPSFHRGVDYVRHYIQHRKACVDALLAGQECELLTCPEDGAFDCRP